jgi:anaerobic dimethyl sulfoxide reductase subunit C (anchor subunit)
MCNWSLVCFTLVTQSAIGLVWVSVMGRWFGGGEQSDFFIWSLVTALILTGLGLIAALTHLSKPRLAPHALRNLTTSWLSREILSVQAFAGAVVLSILASLLEVPAVLIILETAACLLGWAAMVAMIRVYLLKTVPVWNSPATVLEFAGSALLLGGALGGVFALLGAPQPSGWKTKFLTAGIGMLLGLILKLTAISPAVSAEEAARGQTWYAPSGTLVSVGRVLSIRIGLYFAGLALIAVVMAKYGPAWLWAILSLACLGIGEVVARRRFYQAYRRLGL